MADDSDYEFQDIKPDPMEEVVETAPVPDDYDFVANDKQMVITCRPEIRKGCTWDVNFKIDPALLQQEGISKIFLQPPKAGKEAAHLFLKVRSKLIKPILELPFNKVAKIVNDRDYLTPNDAGLIVLKARFTARPRAVFHKHADVMILLAAVKMGERTVCADKLELIFRGGTGSVHGAEGRVKAESFNSNTMLTFQQMQAQMQQMGMQLPPLSAAMLPTVPVTVAPMIGGVMLPSQPGPMTPLVMTENQWESAESGPLTQFESMNSADLRDDFLQNKGDSLLLQQSIDGTNTIPVNFSSEDSNGDWPADADADTFDGGFAAGIVNSAKAGTTSSEFSSNAPVSASASEAQTAESNTNYSIVFNKRRGACVDCIGECSYYKGVGGPCNECGCYPARHLDLDAPKAVNPLKRSSSAAGFTEPRETKRPRFLLEAKFFQKLFFSCMQFMTLPEIARVANAAPIPIFVKDENSVYIYINPTFCHFITDLSRTERVLNHTTQQIFEPCDATEVAEHDKFLVQQGEGTLKTFDVSIKKQEFRVMKEYCALRDGKKVILGAVISSL